MADFLTEKLSEMDRRLEELRPLHDEYLRLERARQALADFDSPTGRGRTATGDGGRRAAARSGGAAPRRGRRRREGGTRAEQALAVVRQNPGITVSELASRLDISQANYLYRVMNGLQAEGAVRREGRGYVAV
jgi:hypothetical protein